MNKYTITYKEHVSKEQAVNYCSMFCKVILEGDTSVQMLQRLCGCIAYNSIYFVPDYYRENAKSYSIENICYFVTGMLKLSIHNLLEKCGNITTTECDYVNELRSILHDCTFAEVMSLLELPVKDVYCSLFCLYAKLSNNVVLENKVREMWKSNTHYIHAIWKYFENEVNK